MVWQRLTTAIDLLPKRAIVGHPFSPLRDSSYHQISIAQLAAEHIRRPVVWPILLLLVALCWSLCSQEVKVTSQMRLIHSSLVQTTIPSTSRAV